MVVDFLNKEFVLVACTTLIVIPLGVIAVRLGHILQKMTSIAEGVNDLNLKVGKIGVRQITSAIRYEDGIVKVSTDTTGEVQEIIKTLREIRDRSK